MIPCFMENLDRPMPATNEMIPYETALNLVLENSRHYGTQFVELHKCTNRVLAEPVGADRDFPPFDRSTKDGIAINFGGVRSGKTDFKVAGIAQAGAPQVKLIENTSCIEVMTGAVVPQNADTVVMYEHLEKSRRGYKITKPPKKGQNIHYRASDFSKNMELIPTGTRITPAEIGVLASIGKVRVRVQKLPKTAVVATGNELVGVHEIPLSHQIRKSNTPTLKTLLETEGIYADDLHLNDDPKPLQEKLRTLLGDYDVLLLSGGVSKGKFDFLPESFKTLGAQKIFHKVMQRPGKPFWFGSHTASNTMIFAFPGNPVSTYVNYHIYFKPWLNKTLGVLNPHFTVLLENPVTNGTDLTQFKGAKIEVKKGRLQGKIFDANGSGDLVRLSKIDGFVELEPNQNFNIGDAVPFIATKKPFSA